MTDETSPTPKKRLKKLRETPYRNTHGEFLGNYIDIKGRFFQFTRGKQYMYVLCYEDDPVNIRMAPKEDSSYWQYRRNGYVTAQYPLQMARQLRAAFQDDRWHVKKVLIADGEVHGGRPRYRWETEGYGRGKLTGVGAKPAR